MSTAFTIALVMSLVAYTCLILRRWLAWQKMLVQLVPVNFIPDTRLSVIIPVRNEEANILHLLQDLEQQQYPNMLYEVLVVDDASEDDTAAIVAQFAHTSNINIKLIKLTDFEELRQKKAAVTKGIEVAQGELLVFTDGDCRVQPEWLLLYAYTYVAQKPVFISGPVGFHKTRTLLERMQLVEFASLIGIGAASIGLRKPNMCNGANLAYTKEIFQKVGGFAGNEGIASGDDEFLLHKVQRHQPERIVFLKHPAAIVHTQARPTVRSFIEQRIRWASKWKAYQNVQVQLVALIVFIINLLLFVAIPMVLCGKLPVMVFVVAYISKFAVDFLFLERVLQFLRKRHYLVYMLPLQLVYIPYILVAAVGGLLGRYSWKGRTIRTK